jgi:arylsulfatase A-like enzyme
MPQVFSRQRIVSASIFLLAVAAIVWWAWPSAPGNDVSITGRDGAGIDAVANGPEVPVIVYLVDTLRADRLGLYGYDRATSWRLDALAAESVVFDQAYAPAPWTLPSVTSLVTSTFTCEHQMTETMKTWAERKTAVGPGPALRTLAERLGEIGYLSGGFVSNSVVSPASGLHRGYDEYVLTTKALRDAERMQNMQAFMDRADGGPFLLYVHTMEPHNPVLTPARFVLRIGDVDPDEMQDYIKSTLVFAELRHEDWSKSDPLGTTDNTKEQDELLAYFTSLQDSYNTLYDASILRADANISDLVKVLKARGIWDKAIFIFLSDHGEEFGDHGGWFHGQSAYEELMRVPLMIHFPGGEFAGERVQEVVSLVDIMPTVFDYLGRNDLCEGCRGTSLLPLLKQTPEPMAADISIPGLRMNQVLFYRPWNESRGEVNVVLRQNQWKGIWNQELESMELYDLVKDPAERSDLSSEKSELSQAMSVTAQEWFQECSSRAQSREEIGEIDEETREALRALGYFN